MHIKAVYKYICMFPIHYLFKSKLNLRKVIMFTCMQMNVLTGRVASMWIPIAKKFTTYHLASSSCAAVCVLSLVLVFSFQNEIRWRDFKFIDVFSDNCIVN